MAVVIRQRRCGGIKASERCEMYSDQRLLPEMQMTASALLVCMPLSFCLFVCLCISLYLALVVDVSSPALSFSFACSFLSMLMYVCVYVRLYVSQSVAFSLFSFTLFLSTNCPSFLSFFLCLSISVPRCLL